MLNKKTPLVSIIVATYNSSLYVRETLDSAMSQTYPNIEIIITDDYSTDNTVEVCGYWIEQHRDYGKRLELVKAKKNSGVSGNFNRGIAKANGEWLKVIAGDDVLLPEAIKNYMEYVSTNPEAKFVFGQNNRFVGHYPNYTYTQRDIGLKHLFFLNPQANPMFQYNILCRTYVGNGPTFFCKAETFRELGGFDERFALQEDWPFYIKLTKNGYQLYLLDKITVSWRQNENSITHQKDQDDVFFSKSQTRIVKEYKCQYLMEELNTIWRFFLRYSLWIRNKVIDSGNSRKIAKSVMYYRLYQTTDPFNWSSRFYYLQNSILKLIKR